MRAKTKRSPLRHLVALGLGTLIGWSSPGQAAVQRIVIDQTATISLTPIIMGTETPGAATSYTVYEGRSFGDVDPSDPQRGHHRHRPRAEEREREGRLRRQLPDHHADRSGTAQRTDDPVGAEPRRQLDHHDGAAAGGHLRAERLAGRPADAMLARPPRQPYPCFDLNSGPYGTPEHHHGRADAAAGARRGGCVGPEEPGGVRRPGAGGHERSRADAITGPVYGHVCTGPNGCGLAVGSAPTSTAQLVIQGPAFVPYQPASMDTSQAQFWTVSSQTFTGVDRRRRRRSRATSGPGRIARTAGPARRIRTGSA